MPKQRRRAAHGHLTPRRVSTRSCHCPTSYSTRRHVSSITLEPSYTAPALVRCGFDCYKYIWYFVVLFSADKVIPVPHAAESIVGGRSSMSGGGARAGNARSRNVPRKCAEHASRTRRTVCSLAETNRRETGRPRILRRRRVWWHPKMYSCLFAILRRRVSFLLGIRRRRGRSSGHRMGRWAQGRRAA